MSGPRKSISRLSITSARTVTKISSAFKVCKQLLDHHYLPYERNIYLFHFSDGDNSSEVD